MGTRNKITVVGAGNVARLPLTGWRRKNLATWCWLTSLKACRKARPWTWPRRRRLKASM